MCTNFYFVCAHIIYLFAFTCLLQCYSFIYLSSRCSITIVRTGSAAGDEGPTVIGFKTDCLNSVNLTEFRHTLQKMWRLHFIDLEFLQHTNQQNTLISSTSFVGVKRSRWEREISPHLFWISMQKNSVPTAKIVKRIKTTTKSMVKLVLKFSRPPSNIPPHPFLPTCLRRNGPVLGPRPPPWCALSIRESPSGTHMGSWNASAKS